MKYILLIAFSITAQAKENVQDIIKQIELRSSPPNERVDMQMVIREADGAKKVRELTILRKNSQRTRSLIRLQKPVDLQGLSFLTVTNGKKEEQYLYLPSDKKSRRILGSNKKGRFLDSEIAYEDLAISTYKEFNNKITKSDQNTLIIESKIKRGSDSTYGRIVTRIAKPDYRIEKVEYYDKDGSLLKRAEFKGYQKVGDRYWRARNVIVKNAQTKRQTQLSVRRVSLNPIDESEISLAALAD